MARTAAVRRPLARPTGRRGLSLFKAIFRGYGAPVRARQPAAVAALAVVLVLLWAPVAGAANEPPSPIGNPNYPRHGHGRDPCTVRNHLPPWCQQAPEAPVALLYPAAAVAALTLFVLRERRRRPRTGQA